MFIETTQIPINSITMGMKWNLHPWAHNTIPENLELSLLTTGVIHLPILLPVDEQRTKFEIVSGTRRIKFLQKNLSEQNPIVHCRILSPEISVDKILALVLEEQLYSGMEMSLAEKARFIQIANNYFSDKQIFEKFGKRLQLKISKELFKNLGTLLNGPEILLEEVHYGRLQEKLLTEILRLPEIDQRNVVHLFQTLQLGGGKQRRLFSLLRDCAYGVPTSISEFLKDQSFREIMEQDQLNAPQKFQHLSTYLEQEIHPASLRAENEFTEMAKQLKLPENYSLEHTPAFEKDEVKLSIVFKDFRDCQHYLKKNQ